MLWQSGRDNSLNDLVYVPVSGCSHPVSWIETDDVMIGFNLGSADVLFEIPI